MNSDLHQRMTWAAEFDSEAQRSSAAPPNPFETGGHVLTKIFDESQPLREIFDDQDMEAGNLLERSRNEVINRYSEYLAGMSVQDPRADAIFRYFTSETKYMKAYPLFLFFWAGCAPPFVTMVIRTMEFVGSIFCSGNRNRILFRTNNVYNSCLVRPSLRYLLSDSDCIVLDAFSKIIQRPGGLHGFEPDYPESLPHAPLSVSIPNQYVLSSEVPNSEPRAMSTLFTDLGFYDPNGKDLNQPVSQSQHEEFSQLFPWLHPHEYRSTMVVRDIYESIFHENPRFWDFMDFVAGTLSAMHAANPDLFRNSYIAPALEIGPEDVPECCFPLRLGLHQAVQASVGNTITPLANIAARI